jgi:hypothetical protein
MNPYRINGFDFVSRDSFITFPQQKFNYNPSVKSNMYLMDLLPKYPNWNVDASCADRRKSLVSYENAHHLTLSYQHNLILLVLVLHFSWARKQNLRVGGISCWDDAEAHACIE